MAAVVRNDLNSNVLQTWLTRKTLEVFEPNLYFYKLGEQPMVESGYNTTSWAKFDQIAASSVTTGTTSNDGVTPSDTAFNATVITATPTQYRVVVSLADLVVELNVIGFLGDAAKAVGDAMARQIDAVIQTTVMAGSNVYYANGTTIAAGRPTLLTTEVLTASLLNKACAKLESLDAPKINGMYVAVISPYQLYDLRNSTSAGGWLDVSKYANPEQIYKGEIGALFGVRVVVSSHVQTFASSVTVYPALVVGAGAYGVGTFQSLKVYATPAVASDSDPLAQRRKVGAKVAFAAKILQESAMVRIETGTTL
jgi:N4-gp56 family major capsid protein